MNPGDRPRRGVLVGLGIGVLVAAVVVPLAVTTDEAAASELERFTSCEELKAWAPAEEFAAGTDDGVAVDRAGSSAGTGTGTGAPAAPEAARQDADGGTAATGGGSGTTGETNVIVEGVDELDVVDRIDEDTVLVAAQGHLQLVDLAGGTVLATLDVPFDARLTHDPDAGIVWVAGSVDQATDPDIVTSDIDLAYGGTTVSRVAVGDVTLTLEGSWTVAGYLLDARRVGDRLHVVAVDGSYYYGGGDVIPFEGGPVPCDQVLHPVEPSDPQATLLVTLPATGDVAPTAATEIVGSGQLVHVTLDAAYLATPLYDTGTTETSIHRFDLADLTHTGSGRVSGQLLNQFAMSEHEGFLRVALSQPGFFGRGIPTDDFIVEDAVPPADAVAETIIAEPARAPDKPVPLPEPVPPLEEPPVTEPPVTEPPVTEPAELLNDIVVLDTDGDLDVVGQTPRFGHPGETLQGIRFVGPVAYAVTFLQTDPFYVVDLADPANPQVVGEVELPGFSSYLHPVAEGLVAGFGPGGDGRMAVKLFDVSDPANPQVVDDAVLGDDSPVAYDHHAYLSLGAGRFAVPATTWRTLEPAGCTEALRQERYNEANVLQTQLNDLYNQPTPNQAAIDALNLQLEEIYTDPCVSPQTVSDTSVVTADTTGGRLDVDRPVTITAEEQGTRLLVVDDGWAILAGAHLVVVDASGATAADILLA